MLTQEDTQGLRYTPDLARIWHERGDEALPRHHYEALARIAEKFLDSMHETAQAHAELVISRVEEIDGPIIHERGEMLVEAQRRLHAAFLEYTLAIEGSIEGVRNLRDDK